MGSRSLKELMDQSTFSQYATKMRLAAERSALGVGCDPEDARDVASEVMVSLWSMHHRLLVRSCVAYAAVTAKHKAINFFRDRRLPIVGMEEDFDMYEEFSSPEERYISNEEVQWLLDEMDRLPSTQQTILRLRQCEMLETDEIARRLGLTPASVSTLLSRARRAMFNAIKERRINERT